MYLTAHHVVAPHGSGEGINAFFYLHGPQSWEQHPPPGVPDENPGSLVHQSLSLQPGGNNIKSYLDIVAPDGTPWSEIRQSFMSFVSKAQLQRLPWSGSEGRCLFRLDMDTSLSRQWYVEVANLYRAAQAVRIGG